MTPPAPVSYPAAMRRAFLAALCLVACSSDPAPATDAGPADTGSATDLGAPADTGIDVPRDTGTDQGPPIDDPPVATDTGPRADVGADTGPTDSGPPDTGPAADVPAQLCAEYDRACTTDSECAVCSPVRGMAWCCGAVAGRRQCVVPSPDGTCMGADAGPPPDVGGMCGDGTERRSCDMDSECGGCLPRGPGDIWCCINDPMPVVRGYCGRSTRPCSELRADAGR